MILFKSLSSALGGLMKSVRQGGWINFELRDPRAQTVRLATTCIATSAESAGHFTTVRSTGKIVGINDKVTASPQTPQDGPARAQRSSR